MASTLKINTLTGVTTAGSIAVTAEGNSTTTNLQQGLCKAFIGNMTDGGTFSIGKSFNSSGQTDNGDGDYNYALTNNLADTNFCASGEAGGNYSDQYSRIISHQGSTTSSIRCRCSNSSDYTTYSNNRGSSAIHGDLA
jgi:hypothetical protein